VPVEKTSGVRKTAAMDVRATADLLDHAVTQRGETLAELVSASSVLLVFLRHAGCTFCREALADIAGSRQNIEGQGIRIVLVHLGDADELDRLLEKNSLCGLDRLCDPNQELYKAFGLKRGTALQLFGPKVWWRGIKAGLISGHGMGMPAADASQMPGVFLLEQGVIARRFRHRSAADRPDYEALCNQPALKSAERK